MSKHIPDINAMTDIETMGKKPGCIILSIALVPFHTEYKLEPFYAKIDVNSSIEAGFDTPDEDTIAWWGNLPPEVYQEAVSGGRPVREVFEELSTYIKALPGNPLIWGCGSDFDNVIILEAFDILGIERPFNHYGNACFRTLRRLFKDKVNYVKPTMSHSALADAQAQATQADRILTLLEGMFEFYEDKTTSDEVVKLKYESVKLPIINSGIELHVVEGFNDHHNNKQDDGSEATSAYVNQDR